MTIRLKTGAVYIKAVLQDDHVFTGCIDSVSHDAAVAHARQKALDSLPQEWRNAYEAQTLHDLRQDFGIED